MNGLIPGLIMLVIILLMALACGPPPEFKTADQMIQDARDRAIQMNTDTTDTIK